jgi:hypothetical protein
MAGTEPKVTDSGAAGSDEPVVSDIDPIWTSSRTARQIYSLGQVEKVRIRIRPTLPPLRLSPSVDSASVLKEINTGYQPSTRARRILDITSHPARNGRAGRWAPTRRRALRAFRARGDRVF